MILRMALAGIGMGDYRAFSESEIIGPIGTNGFDEMKITFLAIGFRGYIFTNLFRSFLFRGHQKFDGML